LPHLVALGSYIASRHDARVAIFDRDYERRISGHGEESLLSGSWDVIGLSCYTSFDYAAVMAMAELIRSRCRGVCLAVGGYHPSACPEDFCGPESPFDHVVVGEGEIPLSRIVEGVQNGRSLDARVLGPEALTSIDELPPLKWELLERYSALFTDGCQLNLNLSRGCPFPCAFCMEPGKRSLRWRAYSPARAVEEMQRLLAAFPRARGVLRITDAVFGLDPGWRHDVLERLKGRPLPVNKTWAVTRSDLLDDSDISHFDGAGFAVGFGIESGDADMLRVMRKTSDPAKFLERFAAQAQMAEVCGLPWGVNLIAGHPGETPESLSRSAEWMRTLVASLRRPTGFLCVDPYRYYPGSAVHRDRLEYEGRFGTRILVPDWWRRDNPTVDSMRVDASRTLNFDQRERLRRSLFAPVLEDLLRRFAYNGPEKRYFEGALLEEVQFARESLS